MEAVARAKLDALDGRASRRSDQMGVRDEILGSWHRSRMCGLDPSSSMPVFRAEARAEGRLTRTVAEVVTRHWATIDQGWTSLQLTDAAGVVLRRWTPDRAFARRLGRMGVDAGFGFDEASIGTNSTGIILETKAPARVVGEEHFAEQYSTMACYGAPIIHPVNRRLLGVLNLTCRADDVNAFQEPWLLALVDDLRRTMWEHASARERLLLQEFLATPRDGHTLVVALSDKTVISNDHALQRLTPTDHAVLWELVKAAESEQRFDAGRLPPLASLRLSAQDEVSVHIQPVRADDRVVGAIVRMRPPTSDATTRRRPRPSSGRAGGPSQPDSDNGAADRAGDAAAFDRGVGRSQAWKAAVDAAHAARHRGRPCLVIGEPGSGTSLVASIVAGTEAVIHECHGVDIGSPAWEALLGHVRSHAGTVVIDHVEMLSATLGASLRRALDARRPGGGPVIGTCATRDGAVDFDDHVAGWFPTWVELPPLRRRLEDVPDLLEALTARYRPDADRPRWDAVTIRALTRLSWRRNVAALDDLVRHILEGHRGPVVMLDHLPPSVRAKASRRIFTGLERAEAEAIARALADAGGNKAAAAAQLGIARSTLYRRISELGLDLERT